ncbi:MAG: hypothetical protein M3Y21_05025 [Candidatus Eremiobacteraeota bacterium]|nr:hypothetical protein [Candidatus Eremiobacteraeota bacterium]
MTQRFKGYSGIAATASGPFALAAGVVQWLLVPSPQSAHDGHLYLQSGSSAAQLQRWSITAQLRTGERCQRARTLADAHGRARNLTGADIRRGALGRVSAQQSVRIPTGDLVRLLRCRSVRVANDDSGAVMPIAALFAIVGMALLFTSRSLALAWWVLPIGLGFGQVVIGIIVARDRSVRT